MRRTVVLVSLLVACGKGDKEKPPAEVAPTPKPAAPTPKPAAPPPDAAKAEPMFDPTATLADAKPGTLKLWSFSVPKDWKVEPIKDSTNKLIAMKLVSPTPELFAWFRDVEYSATLPDPYYDNLYESWTDKRKAARPNDRVGMQTLDGVAGIMILSEDDPTNTRWEWMTHVLVKGTKHDIAITIHVPTGTYAANKAVVDGIAASIKLADTVPRAK